MPPGNNQSFEHGLDIQAVAATFAHLSEMRGIQKLPGPKGRGPGFWVDKRRSVGNMQRVAPPLALPRPAASQPAVLVDEVDAKVHREDENGHRDGHGVSIREPHYCDAGFVLPGKRERWLRPPAGAVPHLKHGTATSGAGAAGSALIRSNCL